MNTTVAPATRPRKWEDAFLAALRDAATVRAACHLVGVSRSAVYDRRKAFPAFASAWDDAAEDAVDALIGEARRRAVQGVENPVYYRGEVVGYVRRYSDNLLMFLIKAARPEYRDNYKVTHAGPADGPVQVEAKPFDVFARIAELTRKDEFDAPGPG